MALAMEDLARLAVAILSILVFLIGLAAYVRRPTVRMLLVLFLFAAFLAQAILLVVEVFFLDSQTTESAYYAFQLLEIGLVTLIILKR
jgi:hypothetical protein